jgi:hypothetical protein
VECIYPLVAHLGGVGCGRYEQQISTLRFASVEMTNLWTVSILRYSERRASTGLDEAARWAGTAQAMSESAIMVAIDPVRMNGSVALTLNSMEPSSRESESADESPYG